MAAWSNSSNRGAPGNCYTAGRLLRCRWMSANRGSRGIHCVIVRCSDWCAYEQLSSWAGRFHCRRWLYPYCEPTRHPSRMLRRYSKWRGWAQQGSWTNSRQQQNSSIDYMASRERRRKQYRRSRRLLTSRPGQRRKKWLHRKKVLRMRLKCDECRSMARLVLTWESHDIRWHTIQVAPSGWHRSRRRCCKVG